jgi:hypothetical protein
MTLDIDHGTSHAIGLSEKQLVSRMNIRNKGTFLGDHLITPRLSDQFASL